MTERVTAMSIVAMCFSLPLLDLFFFFARVKLFNEIVSGQYHKGGTCTAKYLRYALVALQQDFNPQDIKLFFCFFNKTENIFLQKSKALVVFPRRRFGIELFL